jgi:hypothetical protein
MRPIDEIVRILTAIPIDAVSLAMPIVFSCGAMRQVQALQQFSYVSEDGADYYVAEDGITYYIKEP